MNKTENKIYSLIIDTNKPTTSNRNLISAVNSWWETPKKNAIKEISELFKIKEKEEGEGFDLDFNEIKQGEILLNTVFEHIGTNGIAGIESAVLILDSIYHTRLKSPLRVADEIHKLFKTDDLLEKTRNAHELDEIVDCVNKIAVIDKKASPNNNYIYSFATKFCNRINPRTFPIYDSYVAGLLYRYNTKDSFTDKFTQASLGDYKSFYTTYTEFIKEYKIKGFNFKKIDIFMWTYGKLLSSKNNKEPMNLQTSIKYIPQEKTK